MASWAVRAVRDDEYDAWARLFAGYEEFYGREPTTASLGRAWAVITAVDSPVAALVAVPVDADGGREIGAPVGLAHLHEWPRPLKGVAWGYLDDLYVEPDFRGSGVVQVLFGAIDALARSRGWTVVRWTTAVDNHRAQAAYDRVATRTSWVIYDMDV